MKHRKILLVLFLIFALTGCTQPTAAPTPLPTTAAPPSPMPSATHTPALPPPTATDPPTPTVTIFFTPTPTPLSIPGYQRICPNINETLLSELNANGYILLRKEKIAYALTPSTGDLRLLPDIHTAILPIAPNGNWLAHKIEDDNGQDLLEVRPISGNPIFSLPYDENWEYLLYWLDNERVAISYWRGTGDDWASNYGNVIINLFTGQTIKIDGNRLQGFGNPGIDPLYDLSLTRVIYTRREPLGDVFLVLWDLETSEFLWEMNIGDQFVSIRPAWSPDGTQFAVGGPPDLFAYNIVFELFLVDRDGQATQLTHFAEAGLREARITYPHWSPDGRYIAFWLSDSLAVYDTVTGMTSDYCFPASYFYQHRIYWSPDSHQIAVNSDLDDVYWEGPARVVVIDVLSNKAVEITRDYSVIGWMVEEP